MGKLSLKTSLEIIVLIGAIFLIFSIIYDIIFKNFPFKIIELNIGFVTIPNAIFDIVFVITIVSGILWKIYGFDVENKSNTFYKKSNNPTKKKEEIIRRPEDVEKLNKNYIQKTVEEKNMVTNLPKKNQIKNLEKNDERQPSPQQIFNIGSLHIGDNTQIGQQIAGDVGLAKFETPIKAESKTCPKCHNTIHDHERFCSICGKDLT